MSMAVLVGGMEGVMQARRLEDSIVLHESLHNMGAGLCICNQNKSV